MSTTQFNPNILKALEALGAMMGSTNDDFEGHQIIDQYPKDKGYKFNIKSVSGIEAGEKDEDGNEREYRVLKLTAYTAEGNKIPTTYTKTIFKPTSEGNKYQEIWDLAQTVWDAQDSDSYDGNVNIPETTAITVKTKEAHKSWNAKTKKFFTVKTTGADGKPKEEIYTTKVKEDLIVLGGIESAQTVARRFIRQLEKTNSFIKDMGDKGAKN